MKLNTAVHIQYKFFVLTDNQQLHQSKMKIRMTKITEIPSAYIYCLITSRTFMYLLELDKPIKFYYSIT